MKFVLIPPGEFTMGSSAGEVAEAIGARDVQLYPPWRDLIESEAPKHKVILSQPFYMGVHEVTQGQYASVMGTHPSHFSAHAGGKEVVAGADTTQNPVESVGWNDAATFCAKLSKQEGLRPLPVDTYSSQSEAPQSEGYRLPKEAEWEFACRAGTTTRYWSGDKEDALSTSDWIGPNSGKMTHPVGTRSGNPFGVFDLYGNVYEWVQDSWMSTYYSQFGERPAIDPSGPAAGGDRRMIRGGHWNNLAVHCRSSSRAGHGPLTRLSFLGFRVALSVEAVKAPK
jgi:formylglycine-generating enzyme required for sulfatase activity